MLESRAVAGAPGRRAQLQTQQRPSPPLRHHMTPGMALLQQRAAPAALLLSLLLLLLPAPSTLCGANSSVEKREYLDGCPGQSAVVTPYHTFCTYSFGVNGPANILGDYQGGAGQPILSFSLRETSLCYADSNTTGYERYCAGWSTYDTGYSTAAGLSPSMGSCQCSEASAGGAYCQAWGCIKIDNSQVSPAGAAGGVMDDTPALLPAAAIFKTQTYTCLTAARNGLFCAQWAGNSVGGFSGSPRAYPSESGSRVPFYRLYTCTATSVNSTLPALGGAYDEDSTNSTYCYAWKMRLESKVEYGTGTCACLALSLSGAWCLSWTCTQLKAPLQPHYWVYLLYALLFATHSVCGLLYLGVEYLFLAPPARLRRYGSKPTTWILEGLALLSATLAWVNIVVCFFLMKGATAGAQNGYYSLLWALVVPPCCLGISFALHLGLRLQTPQMRRFDDDRMRLWHMLANMLGVCTGNLVAMVCSVGSLGAVIGAAIFGLALLLFAALQPISAARASNAAAATGADGGPELALSMLPTPVKVAVAGKGGGGKGAGGKAPPALVV